VEHGLLTKGNVPESVLQRYTHGGLVSARLNMDRLEVSDIDSDTRLDPIAIHAEALHYYVDVLCMLRTTDKTAVTRRREAWRAELARLRELSEAAADARGEWRCDDCGQRTSEWSHGDAQWLPAVGWACNDCYQQLEGWPEPPPPPHDSHDAPACAGGGVPHGYGYETFDAMQRDPFYRSHWLYHQGCMDQRKAETGERPGSLRNPWQGPEWMHGVEPATDPRERSGRRRTLQELDRGMP
jgi:hypothetical protein